MPSWLSRELVLCVGEVYKTSSTQNVRERRRRTERSLPLNVGSSKLLLHQWGEREAVENLTFVRRACAVWCLVARAWFGIVFLSANKKVQLTVRA